MYTQKLIDDLYKNYDDISNYELIIYENLYKSNLTIHEDIILYLQQLYQANTFDSLTIIGFSYGGVVASHVMSNINNIICFKKIITYDTPLQIIDNVVSFQNNWLYRLDIMYYNIAYNTYCVHHNYNDISPILSADYNNIYFRLFGGDKLVDLVKNIHNCSLEYIQYNASFNYNLDSNIKLIHICCENDPIVNSDMNKLYYKNNSNKTTSNITTINKPCIGHCSDMSFSNKYLIDIINALNM
jgi:hypothetical protein